MMTRDNFDSLDRDVTHLGEKSSDPRDASLGDQSTFGDAQSSVSDLKDLGGEVTDEVEVIDLRSRYEIEGTIGRGGMGEVLLATDKRLRRQVAIKRIHGEMAQSKRALQRFLTEARAVAALNHFNIVQIYDYGRCNDGPFIVMELVEGDNLLEKLRSGPLPVDQAIGIACQLCEALGAAHRKGVVHRDIKPANVLLTTDGVPKLTDFGLANQSDGDHGQTVAGAVLGTIDFMAPEQRRDATQADARSDLWSLAATLYQMVTGKSPRIIRFDLVPAELTAVLGKALEEDKDCRYQTASDFHEALRQSSKFKPGEAGMPLEVSAGECPECRVTNESHRKFCRECGISLRVQCFGCQAQIPLWDKICPECGAKQFEIAAAKRAELDARREQAESLRTACDFAAAIQIAEEISEVQDRRIAHLQKWAAEFATSSQAEWDQKRQFAQERFQEAQWHRVEFDYRAAIQAIESIPEQMRTSDMMAHLAVLRSDFQESESLLQTIRMRIANRELDGLLELVERAAELRGDRSDLGKLRGQLETRRAKQLSRRDDAFVTAEAKLQRGSAKEAWALIESAKESELTLAQQALRQKVLNAVEAEESLVASVAKAKAEGSLLPANVVAVFAGAAECLKLNPNHGKAKELLRQMEEQILKAPEVFVGFPQLRGLWQSLTAETLAKFPASALFALPASVQSQVPRLAELAPSEQFQWPPGAAFVPSGRAPQPPVVQSARLKSKPMTIDLGGQVKMELALIPASDFLMGSAAQETQRGSDEQQHPVRITSPFYLAIVPTTQAAYEQIMGNNPSCYRGADLPVENVSWEDAVAFCRKLSDLLGQVYRLPTEAEWEFACRAGTMTPFHFGMVLNGQQANCDGNSPYGTWGRGPNVGRTTSVGSYAPPL